STLLPLIPVTLKVRYASAAITECARARQRPRQNLDPVPAPAGKTLPYDHRRPHPPCSRPGATHTRLSRKDRKLLHRVFWLRLKHGIQLMKGSLATPPRFPVKLRSQPLRHLWGHGRNSSPKDAC